MLTPSREEPSSTRPAAGSSALVEQGSRCGAGAVAAARPPTRATPRRRCRPRPARGPGRAAARRSAAARCGGEAGRRRPRRRGSRGPTRPDRTAPAVSTQRRGQRPRAGVGSPCTASTVPRYGAATDGDVGQPHEPGVVRLEVVAGVEHGRGAPALEQRVEPLRRRAELGQLVVVAAQPGPARGSRTARTRSRTPRRRRRPPGRAAQRCPTRQPTAVPATGVQREAEAAVDGRDDPHVAGASRAGCRAGTGRRPRCRGWSGRHRGDPSAGPANWAGDEGTGRSSTAARAAPAPRCGGRPGAAPRARRCPPPGASATALMPVHTTHNRLPSAHR